MHNSVNIILIFLIKIFGLLYQHPVQQFKYYISSWNLIQSAFIYLQGLMNLIFKTQEKIQKYIFEKRSYQGDCFLLIIINITQPKGMFLQEEEQQQPVQMVYPDEPLKPNVIPTYATQSMTPTNLNVAQHLSFQKFTISPKTSVDISLQEQIFQDNAQMLKSAVVQYLKLCLGEKFYEIRGSLIKNILIPNQNEGYQDEQPIQQFITTKNKLLNAETQISIFNSVRQFQQITSLFRQIKLLLGDTITHQFAFIMANLLNLKFDSFKKMQNQEISQLIPQMERFWGDQGEQELLPNGWEIYEDIDYSSIKKFAVDKIEQMASKLYYASQLQFLNLSQVQICNAQTSERFCSLVCLFSETLFLTMSGMRQRKQDLQEFLQQLRMDLSSGDIHNQHPMKRTKLE